MNLCITLGHNSSAVLINESGEIITGFEEERLTEIKSDKNFPINAINHCLTALSENQKNELQVYISHWYDNFDFNTTWEDSHRFNKTFLQEMVEKYNWKVHTLSESFTHHDAHAYSSYAFLKNNMSELEFNSYDKHLFIVSDGFGNRQEVVSFYEYDSFQKDLRKTKEIKGYINSLGLMYQYATAFMGMKENQDEYKALGYESRIRKVLSHEGIVKIDDHTTRLFDLTNKATLTSNEINSDNTGYINFTDLDYVRSEWNEKFKTVMKLVEHDIITEKDANETYVKRVIISYFIQYYIEFAMEFYVREMIESLPNYCKSITLNLSGGIFYNVKLNNYINKVIRSCCASPLYPIIYGNLSVMPLSGDQGAGLGLYTKSSKTIVRLNSLLLGRRNLVQQTRELDNYIDSHENSEDIRNNIQVIPAIHDCEEYLLKQLSQNNIVNFVSGAMEFGPRALLSNSTLAIPYKENVDIINNVNGRTTVMPFAPVILDSSLGKLFNFEEYNTIIGSLKYMICTLYYQQSFIENKELLKKHIGVMHPHPILSNCYSGRPQVISGNYKHPITNVLKVLQKTHDTFALIQTSFNVHGFPIVYNVEQVIKNFAYQLTQAKKLKYDISKIKLVIYTG